jgi:hypothetical protein
MHKNGLGVLVYKKAECNEQGPDFDDVKICKK